MQARASLKALGTGEQPVGREVIDNATQLLDLVVDFYPAPRIERGHFPTACIYWEVLDREVEVFPDRYEIYDLSVDAVVIDVINHCAGEVFSDALFAKLPRLSRN